MNKSANIPNRLLKETSPYLLQHAYNPVDWYPWGKEAFEKAHKENKPVFLSIGYSTCHWCHVMARESFSDEAVAAILNKNFVAIKVDKEERPDIDSVYMDVCQALTGSGGWPLTIFLTPAQKPFFAGTYFPKNPRYGQPGLIQLLESITAYYQQAPDEITKVAEAVFTAISKDNGAINEEGECSAALDLLSYRYFENHFDHKYGGFSNAPKFPTPHNLLFLIRYSYFNGNKKALSMAEETLIHMYKGGIYDHIGGGFSRYSTDEMWLVPHFEKMLYDNALLSLAYLEAYRYTGKEIYLHVAESVFDYVERELTAPSGAFFSAQDADSDGEEGRFYTFSQEELLTLLGEKSGRKFCEHYGIRKSGNFEGKNIPNLLHHHNDGSLLIEKEIESLRQQVFTNRSHRYELHKDDKILTSWNGFMILALAEGYMATGKRRYLSMAQKAFQFILTQMCDEEGNLSISFRHSQAKGCGILDDYASMILASLTLYEANFQPFYLKQAIIWADKVEAGYFDHANNGYFLTSAESEELFIRPKEFYDGAMPSGNSVMAYNLTKLFFLTAEVKWQEASQRQLSYFQPIMKKLPGQVSFAMLSLIMQKYPHSEVVHVPGKSSKKQDLWAKLKDVYSPNTTWIIKHQKIEELVPFLKDYQETADDRYFYCENGTCHRSVTSIEEVISKLMYYPSV